MFVGSQAQRVFEMLARYRFLFSIFFFFPLFLFCSLLMLFVSLYLVPPFSFCERVVSAKSLC